MRTAALVLFLALPLAAQQSGVEGTVFNGADGQPLSGVHLRLYAAIMIEGATVAYGAVSTADGHYSVASLPAANYTAELERTGFLQVPGDGFLHQAQVALNPGQHLTGYRLSMLPLIRISGRIVNQNGDPVPGATVEATTKPLDPRGPRMADYPPSTGPFRAAVADERGQFRLFVPPGKYYLASWLLELGFRADHVPGGPGVANTSPNNATVTYYPDSPDTDSATEVEVKPGAEIPALTIRLRDNGPRVTLNVSGVVTGVPPGLQPTVYYSQGPNPDGTSRGGTALLSGEPGAFSIRSIPPGTVRLMAQISSGDTQLQSDVVDVHLTTSSVSDVHLALAPGGVLSGSLEISGADAAPSGKLKVRLAWMESSLLGSREQVGPVGADGAFRIDAIPPGQYHVALDALPEGAYIKSVKLNDAPVADYTLDFSHGVRAPAPVLKVVLSLKGAQVSGEVRNPDGSALLAPNNVTVFLAPEPNQSPLTRTGVPVIDGRYVLNGIPPGKYRIYAADLIRGGSVGMQAEKDALAATAETIELKEGDRLTKDLKAVDTEVRNANPRQ